MSLPWRVLARAASSLARALPAGHALTRAAPHTPPPSSAPAETDRRHHRAELYSSEKDMDAVDAPADGGGKRPRHYTPSTVPLGAGAGAPGGGGTGAPPAPGT